MPPDIQYELLTSYKDALKAKKSQSFNEFPEVIMIYHKKCKKIVNLSFYTKAIRRFFFISNEKFTTQRRNFKSNKQSKKFNEKTTYK